MLSPDELINEIDAQHLIVTRLREMIGVSAVFNERYWPLLQRVAKWLYDIPLSKKTHSEPGGALRHAIEAGFIARSMAESMVFASDAPSEARRELEAQYQYISFVSAVCSVLHKPSLEIEVVAEDTGETWSELDGPLHAWAESHALRLFRWRSAPLIPYRQVAPFLARHVLGEDVKTTVSPPLFREMLGAMAPDAVPVGQESALQRLIRQSIQKSMEWDLRNGSVAYVHEPRKPQEPASAINSLPSEMNDIPPLHGAAKEEGDPSPSAATDTPQQSVLKLDKSLQQLLESLRDDIKAGNAKASWTEEGLVLPRAQLGEYGMSSTMVIGLLTKAGLLVKKEGNSVLLSPQVKQILEKEGA